MPCERPLMVPSLNHPDTLAVASDDFLRHVIAHGRPGTNMTGWGPEGGGLHHLGDVENRRLPVCTDEVAHLAHPLHRHVRIVDREVCGACERIKNTLIAQSYRVFVRQCLFLYLLVLPWGLVDDFEYWTVPLTVLVSYLLVAGEAIAHDVEEPFGANEDHLDLDAICRGIESSVGEILEG